MLDPIPLPAPVWLFKALHLLLLSLHFVAVHLLIGGLAVAFVWNLVGFLKRDAVYRAASNEIAGYLPVVVTYVINLGVPPLLFTQVLYGPALYTSSILIGAYWISVIFLVIAMYAVLYVMAQRAAGGRAWWGWALLSLLIALSVAKIYVTNMTLMIRPEVWLELYRAHPGGTALPPHDPTALPRWVFMMLGGLTITGAALMVVGRRRIFSAERQRFFVTHGGRLTLLFAPLWGGAGWWVWQNQPGAVAQRILAGAIFSKVGLAWLAVAALLALLGLLAQGRKGPLPVALTVVVGLLAIVADALAVIFRDGLRDTTLALKGFNLWNQPVEVNLQVLLIFGALLVVGLALTVWLIAVMARAKPVTEITK
ncbi:MAG: hypothetical protein EPN23_06285 [Verrucomicrobia bacterium]|nr:MAG: hypothetical protein EPN23_06285 [Verrucomicrobiota bacterium]